MDKEIRENENKELEVEDLTRILIQKILFVMGTASRVVLGILVVLFLAYLYIFIINKGLVPHKTYFSTFAELFAGIVLSFLVASFLKKAKKITAIATVRQSLDLITLILAVAALVVSLVALLIKVSS